jgi:hypothetical protein
VVVVTGDHGHVLDEGTAQLGGGSGDRWRSEGMPPRESEIALSGGRVLSPGGSRAIVAAWSERVRFAARRSGYHGGASPQEILVPVAVLAAGSTPDGWTEAPPMEPGWWRGEYGTQLSVSAVEATSPTPLRRRTEARQGDFFADDRRAAAVQGTQSQAAAAAAWLDALLASEIYAAQRRLAGRGAPSDDLVRRLLTALALRGGRMTRAGLSQALEMPTLRLGGLVSTARRVLNLDQAQVLRDDGDDVVLDEALLRAQFGLGGDR